MKRIFAYIVFLFLVTTLTASAAGVSIAQITDVHIGDDEVPNSDPLECLNSAIMSINSRKDIDFVVFTGDNIDKSTPANLKIFCKTARKLNKPYYIIMGNHDAHKIAGIPKDTYMSIIKKANKYQPKAESNFNFSINKYLEAVFVDGVTINVPSTHGFFTDDTIMWLKKTIRKNKNKEILIFQHFPIIPPANNPSHEILEVTNEKNVLLLSKNILLVASGHYHIGKVTVDDDGIYHISTPSLLHERQYRIIRVNYEKSRFTCPKKFEVKTELVDI